MDTDKARDEPIIPHLLSIVKWPDNRLHKKCEDITTFDNEDNKFLTQLFVDMAYTMVEEQGIGIAAPQVGVMANFIVILHQNPGAKKPGPLALVNPKIVSSSEEQFEWEEGCLSVPGFFEVRERPKMIVVQYNDLDGTLKESEFHGLYAFLILHEIDHLNGKLFIDNLSNLKKEQVVKKKVKNFLKKRLQESNSRFQK